MIGLTVPESFLARADDTRAYIAGHAALLEIFPDGRQLPALEPEELAGPLIEIIPGVSQSAWLYDREFHRADFPPQGGGYGPGIFQEVVLAFADASSKTQGFGVQNATPPALWYLVTRRGRALTGC